MRVGSIPILATGRVVLPRRRARLAPSDTLPTLRLVTPRHLLVVPYFYPPFPGSGNRWPTMARYLRREGHRVTVLATDAFGRLDDDEEMDVVRVGDLRSSRSLRRLLRRGELSKAGTAQLEAPTTPLLTKVIVPDAHAVSWLPAAVVQARRIMARVDVDCLITSSPPESAHLLGLLLGSRRPAWIADLRDGWGFEPLRPPFPMSFQRSFDRHLERLVARMAEVAVGATLPIAHDLERRLSVHAAYIPSGWDAESSLGVLPARSSDGEATLVYTGTLSGARGRDAGALLQAIATLHRDKTTPRLRLLLAGRLLPNERELIETSGAAEAVEYLGVLTRPDALALQRSADALLLLTPRASSVATGKLFEYLGAGRPIVALAEGNEAERIVRETNTGVTVPPDDVEAIAAALRRVATGELARSYAPANLAQFLQPGPATAMAALVETAIERRSLSLTCRGSPCDRFDPVVAPAAQLPRRGGANVDEPRRSGREAERERPEGELVAAAPGP